jgi:hypothetical protein
MSTAKWQNIAGSKKFFTPQPLAYTSYLNLYRYSLSNQKVIVSMSAGGKVFWAISHEIFFSQDF